MLCLALRHIPVEDLDSFEAPLRERFAEVRYIDMGAPDALAGLEDALRADLAVSLGGPMGVYEAERYPFIAREIELLRARIRSGRPTLGICLGAQIMAAAAGSRVYASGRQEIGWYPVRFTPEAAANPVWGRLVAGFDNGGTETFFHWHGDTFDLPPGSRLLGSSDLFPHQGFTIGRHAVALQFHAETSPEALARWLVEYERGLKPGAGIMSADAMREGGRRHGDSLRRRSLDFLTRWLDENEL